MSSNRKHTTSVASDGANYYVSDYTSNTSGSDLYPVDKTTGVAVNMSTDVAAFGGYPIDVRDGNLYRTEISTTYNGSNLKQIRISAVATSDSGFRRSRWRPTPASAISRSTKPAIMFG